MLRIAVDAMGGDNGSSVIIDAVKKFLKSNDDVEIIVCGKKEELQALEGVCQVIDTRSVVPMTAGAYDVLKMKDSSMLTAIRLVKEGKADGVVSCGSTGGFLASATLMLKTIPGVKRAALVTAIPRKEKGQYMTLLDCGASVSNSAEELCQFALMGRLYSQNVFGYENPRTCLLSNGGEDEKGTDEVKQANKLLRERNFPNFLGNVEAREAILENSCDVLVASGFSGNIFLKAVEGFAKYMQSLIKDAFMTNAMTKCGYLFAKKGFDDMKKKMDYKAVGGALLLGINGVVVKAHGNSDARAFEGALNVMKKLLANQVVENIKKGIGENGTKLS